MPRLPFAIAGAVSIAAASPLVAQLTAFVPEGFQAVEGNTSWPYPFNYTNATGGMRQQTIYDSVNFTRQGAAGPILINRLRWRADGGATSAGRTWNNVVIQLSTCPLDYLAVSATYANNHGPDLTTVFSGPVTVNTIANGSTPGPVYVDIALTTPFLYDPSTGLDLTIEVDHDGTATAARAPAWTSSRRTRPAR